MKKSTVLTTAALWLTTSLLVFSVQAQELAPIQLNTPSKTRGCDIMQALQQRQSNRAFENTVVNLQDLSDLLWAANGVNRPNKRRTASSALNARDVDVYVHLGAGRGKAVVYTSDLTPEYIKINAEYS